MKSQHLTLSQVVNGFLLEAAARHLSPNTIADYTNSLRKLQRYLEGDPVFDEITTDQVRAFFADLATPRAPAGAAQRPARPIGKKQALNIHTGLSALWTWAVAEGITTHHVMREIGRPEPTQPAVVPFSQADVKALLSVCDRSRPYTRPGKQITDNTRPTGLRDRAIILLLLDTGIRASELCGLTLRHVDLKNRHITVLGKGDKERNLPISATTARTLWKYISAERKDERVNAPVFVAADGRALTRDALLKLLYRLGARAGVLDVHPHRFRHTFAIMYLRNGGNALALQASLGHTTLEMVKTYTAIAQADLENGHRTASPVENWRL